MSKRTRTAVAFLVGVAGIAAIVSVAFAGQAGRRDVNGTIWVANRGANTIRGFDAATGSVVATIAMAANSQPGDLAYAKGKLYVSEEFGSPPAIAIVDAGTGDVLKRIPMPVGSRPHHVHASVGGNLVSVGLYGTDMVAVVDTSDDTLLGPWDTDPTTTTGRAHAGVFSKDGRTLYVASDATGKLIALDPRTGELLWSADVPNAHELAVTHDGKTAYVTGRVASTLRIVDLERRVVTDNLSLGSNTLPDTLQLSANEKLLTVGLRGTPAQVAIIDTATLHYDIVTIGGPGTIAGHQWTSPNGHFTFAAFEGPGAGIAVIDHEQGNAIVQTLDYPGRPHGVDLARPE
jgi:DNA-binding beta-propeller fold protein YncE